MPDRDDEEISRQAMELTAKLLPICREGVAEAGAAAVMMALAFTAAEFIVAASNGEEHLEAALPILADMTAEAARTRFRQAMTERERPN